MKLNFVDLKLAVEHIEKLSDKGDINIQQSDQGSSFVFTFYSIEGTKIQIEVFDSKLSKFSLIREEKWLPK